MNIKNKIAILAVLVCLPLGACNTMQGIGQDTAVAGEAVSDAARDAKY